MSDDSLCQCRLRRTIFSSIHAVQKTGEAWNGGILKAPGKEEQWQIALRKQLSLAERGTE